MRYIDVFGSVESDLEAELLRAKTPDFQPASNSLNHLGSLTHFGAIPVCLKGYRPVIKM